MLEIDPGHTYSVEVFDGDEQQIIKFMKRDRFPPNEGNQAGTNCQELLRVLISRVQYLDAQEPCPENQIILHNLRASILAFEVRAAKRHGTELVPTSYAPETQPTRADGHFLMQWRASDAP